MMKLYDYPDCPFAQKVRVVLAEKELEYETIFVDLRTGEHRQNAEFLKLNPYGKVPVLIDDEVVVYDSTIINEYLEDEYPHPHLMPEDSAARARVRTLEDYCDNSFLPSAGFVQAELSKPVEEQDAERLARYRNELQRGLKRLEAFLAGKEYLVGDFSLADVAFIPALLILPRLGVEVDPALRGVTAWINRLKQRPSVQILER
ncbi:glutathione S-transferase family protein [bacterium]|nr:glutathione S-transferase family protein [bacterium]